MHFYGRVFVAHRLRLIKLNVKCSCLENNDADGALFLSHFQYIDRCTSVGICPSFYSIVNPLFPAEYITHTIKFNKVVKYEREEI